MKLKKPLEVIDIGAWALGECRRENYKLKAELAKKDRIIHFFAKGILYSRFGAYKLQGLESEEEEIGYIINWAKKEGKDELNKGNLAGCGV